MFKVNKPQIKQQFISKVSQHSAADMYIFIQHLFQLRCQIGQHALHDRGQVVDEDTVGCTVRGLNAVAVLLEPIPAIPVLFHRKRIKILVRDMILAMKSHKVLECGLFVVEKTVQRNDTDLNRIIVRIEIDAQRDTVNAVDIVVQYGNILQQLVKAAVFGNILHKRCKPLHAFRLKAAVGKQIPQLQHRADIMFKGTEPLNQLPDRGLRANLHGAVIERKVQGIADAEQFLAERFIAAQFSVNLLPVTDDFRCGRHLQQDAADDFLLR